MRELYDWVPWFTELAKSIADGEPSDLAGRARQLPWKADGATSPLLNYGDSNIDPFSFLYTLATSCTKNHRKLLCESVQNEFALSTPPPKDSDDAFIFPQGILLKTLFHHDGDGNPELLWRLFRTACQGGASADGDDFRDALAIKGVGLAMLTQALFLVNPNEYMPLDDRTKVLLANPATKVDDWTNYQSAIDEVRSSFPGCTLYEANLVAWLLFSGRISTIGQNVYQVSTNVLNDGEDKWNEFETENAVWTGGPGGGANWDEFKSGTEPNKWYPLQEPEPGDLILVRTARQGRAIGITFRNDYVNEFSSAGRLHVVWLNRLTVADLLSNPRSLGLSRAYEIADKFLANDAYHPTRALLDRLGNGGKPGPVEVDGLTREAVLRIISEFDELGRDAFLEKYGYDRSRTYWLVYEGQPYDMKAVWAAAHLEPDAQLPAGMPAGKNNKSGAVQRELKVLEFEIEHGDAGTRTGSNAAEVVAPLNQILYGPPGTGKTFRTTGLAVSIVDGDEADHAADRLDELRFDPITGNGNVAFVTFHQNFAYEDFVEGIRPVLEEEDLRYELRDGIFKLLAAAARNRPGERFVLIIDEINRGNIAKIFGELITLIEDSRRSGERDETFVTLPYSQQSFSAPSNLYLIGTMNTADRSIQLLDTALRRRFKFRECMPESNKDLIPTNIEGVDCQQLLRALNERIALLLDREHQIGHTYFLNVESLDQLADVFRDSVFPLLQEYFFDDWAKIRAVLANNAFVVDRTPKVAFHTPDLIDEDRKLYDRLADDDKGWHSTDEYKAIYSSKRERASDE